MPVKRRIDKHRGFDEHHHRQLLYGFDSTLLGGQGYLTLRHTKLGSIDAASEQERTEILDAMEADWERHRERLMADWTGPGQPWAAKQFERKAGK